jgi:hypothetical protein
MATYQAEIKVGQAGSRFKVQVNAGTITGAKEVINAMYNPEYIMNLTEVSCRDEAGFVSTGPQPPTAGMYWFVGFMFVLYILVTYWYIFVPASAIIAILWLWAKDA